MKQSNIPEVYNGHTAEEWHQLFAREAVSVHELLIACDRASSHASCAIKKYSNDHAILSGHVDDLIRNLNSATERVRSRNDNN